MTEMERLELILHRTLAGILVSCPDHRPAAREILGAIIDEVEKYNAEHKGPEPEIRYFGEIPL